MEIKDRSRIREEKEAEKTKAETFLRRVAQKHCHRVFANLR